jgi:hypothetical protein
MPLFLGLFLYPKKGRLHQYEQEEKCKSNSIFPPCTDLPYAEVFHEPEKDPSP